MVKLNQILHSSINEQLSFMNTISLSLLKEKPTIDAQAMVSIRPLAPLSMVSDMPGSYYKTLKKPDKKMLCGLFENILGWHFDSADRKLLYKELKQIRKKQKVDFKDKYNGSTYRPLLMDYFEIDGDIEIDKFKGVCFYDDLWSRCFRRTDTGGGLLTHIGGCRIIDHSIMAEMKNIFSNIDKDESLPTKKEKDKGKEDWVNDHFGQFPFFYMTPTKREYLSLNGIFNIKVAIDRVLLNLLSESIKNNNIGYLGNSDGWVDLKIEQL